MDNDTSRETSSTEVEAMQRLWPQLRKFGVLQLKLTIDAFRDLLLSALSLGAFIIDLIQQNEGPDSYFEKVLRFGRRTEKSINLFNQFDAQERGDRSVDSIIDDVEDRFRR